MMSDPKYKAGDKVRMIWRTRYAPYGYEAELFMKDGRLHITGNDGRAYPFQPEHWKPVETEQAKPKIDSAAAQREKWQSVETAPTNRAIEVYIPHLDYYGNNGVYAGMLVDMGTGRRWITFGYAIGRDLEPDCLPTHWKPMSPPPAIAAVEQE